jgi:hypothetical protein
MEFRTIVDIPESQWKIEPCERMLFVGSCFADNIGRRFVDEKFRAVVNPFGVMYNPASILHTVERLATAGDMPFNAEEAGTAVFTLGTNHVYILKETGEIVDNCQKRPQRLFQEKELSVSECADYLLQAINLITKLFPLVRFIITVSPIRYRKYGYHQSQLSKATLLLATQSLIDRMAAERPDVSVTYFPSYEIVNDELRDYRFYKPDMLHPSDQAVEYIYDRMADVFFSDTTRHFLNEWKPIREALHHRPFNPDSEDYKAFLAKTMEKYESLKLRFPGLS